MAERHVNELRNDKLNIDLRTSQGIFAVFQGADRLLDITEGKVNLLLAIEKTMFDDPSLYSPLEHLQIKAAVSKARIGALEEPVHLAIVVPMYHEEERLCPRIGSTLKLAGFEPESKVHGENALLRRHAELEWLTQDSQATYSLIFVDDMCDRGSGELAEEIITRNNLSNTRVSYLSEAIKCDKPDSLVHKAVETISQNGGNSIRGGALCLGFAEAINAMHESHREGKTLVGYMDTDSSYSATQLGIPMHELLSSNEIQVATASRQHAFTYMEPAKEESQTSHRSPGLIRLKQVVGYLRKHIVGENVPADTQSGFKLFKPGVLEWTLRQPRKAHNFSYDTQLLARIAWSDPNRNLIQPFGVVVLDCDELSTANNGVTYFAALQILRDIMEENGINHTGENEAWLLRHLTSDSDTLQPYKKLIFLLNDGQTSSVLDPDSEAVIRTVRDRISTAKDTTAVGDYFTSDICADLVRVLKPS